MSPTLTERVNQANLSFQTIYELLRYATISPFMVPHATMEDTTLGGYHLPKDTQVGRDTNWSGSI